MKKLFYVFFLVSLLTPANKQKIVDFREKIIVEQEINRKLDASKATSETLAALDEADDPNIIMSVLLNYGEEELVRFDEEKTEESKLATEEYYYENNLKFIEENNLNPDDFFISAYTPFIFCEYEDISISSVYAEASTVAKEDLVEYVYLGNGSLYEPIASTMSDDFPNIPVPETFSIYDYDNYPANGTSWTGLGTKVGILSTGRLNTSQNGLTNANITVYDTVTQNDADLMPTRITQLIASTKGGIAPKTAIYYADADMSSGLTAIEKLVHCDIVDIDLSYISPKTGMSYNASTDLYIDFLFSTTGIVFVAPTGDTLGYEDMGYVSSPASASNVLAVGSYNRTNVPSTFSSYKIFLQSNDSYIAPDKPQIVAVGEGRLVPTSSSTVFVSSSTRISAASVVATLSLVREKYGSLDYSGAVALLMGTANDKRINHSQQTIPVLSVDTNDINGNGNRTEYVNLGRSFSVINNFRATDLARRRTGAGALDIAKALTHYYPMISTERPFPTKNRTMPVMLMLDPGVGAVFSFATSRLIKRYTPFGLPAYYGYPGRPFIDVALQCDGSEVDHSSMYGTSLIMRYSSDLPIEERTFSAYVTDGYFGTDGSIKYYNFVMDYMPY